MTPLDAGGDPTNDEGSEGPHEVNPAGDRTNNGGSAVSRELDLQLQRLGAALFSIGDAVIATDVHGRVTLLNRAAEALTGWTENDAKDRPIESVFCIINELTRELVSQPVNQVIEFGIIHNLPQRTILIAKDGTEIPIDDSAAPILGTGGKLEGVALIFRDITERRRLERRPEDAMPDDEFLASSMRDSLVILDGDMRVKSANRSYYATFRALPADTEGRSLFDLGDGQWDIPELRAILSKVLPEDASFDDFEVHKVFPAIGTRSMLLHARELPLKEGQSKTILLDIEDVTKRSQMARALATSEIQFRRLFEAAKDGILMLDAETGAIVDANPFLLDLLGYTHAELSGMHLWEIGLFGNIEASRASFRELQQNGYVRFDDLPLATRDGRQIEVEFVSNVYRVNDHMIIQCNIRDVTERKRAEEELRRAKEAAEEAVLEKDRFLAALSHELRTPLTPVLATISFVEMMPGLSTELRQEILSIRRNVERESRLIDDLLDVARIGRGKLEMHREVLDVHASIRAALEVCQSEIEAKKLEVSLSLGADVHQVWADPARMQQIFWNLIKNAVKFTPVGGRINLRSMDLGEGRVAIEVADTGIGIEPELLLRVFDPFEQGDKSVTRRHGGLGLGLAIAKMLTELQDGVLTVTSEGQSCGSVFRVELATIVIETDRAQPPDPDAGAEQGLPKVLLVDDNLDTLQAIARLLRSSGFDVRTAASVESALTLLEGERFNLLVSDIGLPDGSGLDIMRHGRDHLGLKGIAFSGYGTDQDVRASKEAGFAHHLTKPSDFSLLVDLIRRTAS